MKDYKTIIFDLFDTIVDFNRSLLTVVKSNGAEVRSTSVDVFNVFKEYYGSISFEDFYKAFIESYLEFNNVKRIEDRELYNGERFKLMLGMMNLELNSNTDEVVENMVTVHMKGLANAVEFPEENRSTLNLLRSKNYRLAIISNFDHAPTAYGLLEKFGIKHYFEKIFISVDIGWRKPKRDIFLKAFDILGIEPDEAIFVGDNFDADVVGSKSVGMDVIWINRNGEQLGDGNIKPDYSISKFAEIERIL